MVAIGLQSLGQYPVRHRRTIGERRIGLDDEPVAEIRRDSAMIAGRIADNPVALRDNPHVRALVISIDHQEGGVLRGISQTERGRAGSRSQLSKHIMVSQIDLIVIRCRRFCLVREPTRTLPFVENGSRRHRHQGESSVIIDPGTRLMGLFQPPDPGRGIRVGPSVSAPARLGSPEMHAPGDRHGRICITCRQFKRRGRSG